MALAWDEAPLTSLHGIGTERAAALAKWGICSLRDLIYHFPRTYEDRGRIRRIADGQDPLPATYILTVATKPHFSRLKKNLSIVRFRAFDETGSAEITFFNAPFLKDKFTVGSEYRFFGPLTMGKRGQLCLTVPKFEEHTERSDAPHILPVYRTPEGISQKLMTAAVHGALSAALPSLHDFLPENIRRKHQLMTLPTALKALHLPPDSQTLSAALRRTVFDELFCYAIGLASLGAAERRVPAPAFSDGDASDFLDALPYRLTEAQARALEEFKGDLCGDGTQSTKPPMTRILIGDVGSGKTVLAAAALYLAAKNGHQGVLMVPTEILARQHFADLAPLLAGLGVRTVCLTGALKKKEKETIYRRLQADVHEQEAVDVLIGTHAVLNEQVCLPRLALTVTDEQHRFGIMQRAALREKNNATHLLVMSATPIPRTLALSLYGDLDVSRLDRLPPGRQPVETYLVNTGYRPRLRAFMDKQISQGGQVYIVCPGIEEEDSLGSVGNPTGTPAHDAPPLATAVDYAEELSSLLPHRRIAFLHGRMKPEQRDRIMCEFAEGRIDILVSTTVIEVGVNVPNATLMVIENAERFGLSQLHQLRGRVGRGQRQSYCVLVSDATAPQTKERLQILCRERDGYRIAEADLKHRGPGDFFASVSGDAQRQSGQFSLRMAHLCDDDLLMTNAFEAAKETIKSDPYLQADEHLLLKKEVDRLFALRENTLS